MAAFKGQSRYHSSLQNGKMFKPTLLYKCAANVLKGVSCKNNSLRSLVYSENYKNKDELLAIVCQTLKHKKIIAKVLKRVDELKDDLNGDEFLAHVLIYELLFGKKEGFSKCPEHETVMLKHEEKLRHALHKVEKKAKKKGIELILEPEFSATKIPRYARVNTLLIQIPKVIDSLKEEGFQQVSYDKAILCKEYLDIVGKLQDGEFLQDLHFPELLVFASGTKLFNHYLVTNSYLILQDKSSILPIYELDPQQGSVILDACAAPGIKTSHLAAWIQNAGKIIAIDYVKERFNLLWQTIRRTGATCCKPTFCDFLAINPNIHPYCNVEYILLDPSCSGEGMVRRGDALVDDDITPSVSDERLKSLVGFQIKALKHALRFPRVKRIVYSTCSFTLEENEKIIEEISEHVRDWFQLRRALPNWLTRGSEEVSCGANCVRASPNTDLTNGFFVASFERIKDRNFKPPKTTNNRNFSCKNENEGFSRNRPTFPAKNKKVIFNDSQDIASEATEASFDNPEEQKEDNSDVKMKETDKKHKKEEKNESLDVEENPKDAENNKKRKKHKKRKERELSQPGLEDDHEETKPQKQQKKMEEISENVEEAVHTQGNEDVNFGRKNVNERNGQVFPAMNKKVIFDDSQDIVLEAIEASPDNPEEIKEENSDGKIKEKHKKCKKAEEKGNLDVQENPEDAENNKRKKHKKRKEYELQQQGLQDDHEETKPQKKQKKMEEISENGEQIQEAVHTQRNEDVNCEDKDVDNDISSMKKKKKKKKTKG